MKLICRFINHVTLLAANESGDISTRMPMAQLAGTINVPEWLVSLRHQISHGATIPSLEALRVSSTFIKGWLKVSNNKHLRMSFYMQLVTDL